MKEALRHKMLISKKRIEILCLLNEKKSHIKKISDMDELQLIGQLENITLSRLKKTRA